MSLVTSWLICVGEWWAMLLAKNGAVNARKQRMIKTIAEPIAIRSRLKRIQKSCQGVRPLTSSETPSTGMTCSTAGSDWTWLMPEDRLRR